MNKRLTIIVLSFLISLSGIAQHKHFTIEDLWRNFTFRTQGISDIRSMIDGKHFTVLDGNCIIRYSYETGKVTDTLVCGDNIYDEAGDALMIMEYEFSADESRILLGTNLRSIYRHSTSGFFYVYDIHAGNVTPLAPQDAGRQRLAE
ncbi:MAG: S9 family peptidase, partial [Bacteroidales bacterium]